MGQYEDTLEDIKKTFGRVPEFMRCFPREVLIREWPSWKRDSPGEIDLERARYLLSTDEAMEEMLDETQNTIPYYREGEFSRKARTVCCGALVDTSRAPMARTKTGEQFLVCNDGCRRFVETATLEQIREMATMELH